MSDLSPPPASPASAPARAFLSVQGLFAVLVGLLFGLVFLGAFLTSDAGLKHDLAEVLKACVYTVVGYYFGSSIGSRLKDASRGQHDG